MDKSEIHSASLSVGETGSIPMTFESPNQVCVVD